MLPDTNGLTHIEGYDKKKSHLVDFLVKNNINIQKTYTLIELPDEMPPDIFLHLKSVEINQCKLDIKRLKPRNNKRRSNSHFRRNRKHDKNHNQTQTVN